MDIYIYFNKSHEYCCRLSQFYRATESLVIDCENLLLHPSRGGTLSPLPLCGSLYDYERCQALGRIRLLNNLHR